jgi:hypothetical protein
MASACVAALPVAGGRPPPIAEQLVASQPTKQELLELREYQKIIQLRNDVLQGFHPRIKLPAPLAEKVAVAGRAPPPTQPPPRHNQQRSQRANPSDNILSFASNSAHVAAPTGPRAGPNLGLDSTSGSARPFATATSKPEINPIFLEKSDHLIKAEIGLQRTRLERALREELEAKKGSPKTNTTGADQPPASDVDVDDVLAKATVLASAPAQSTTTAAAATNAADDDTSFDENDYYSSRHNSTDSEDKASAGEGGLGTMAARHASPKIPTAVSKPREQAAPAAVAPQPTVFTIPGLQSLAQPAQLSKVSPKPRVETRDEILPTPIQTSSASANNSGGEDGARTESTSRAATRGHSSYETGEAGRSDGGIMDLDQGQSRAALVRSHNLSPIAPQPAHVSRLAAAGRVVSGSGLSLPRQTPAQVSALRNVGSAKSSPDSNSPLAPGPKKKDKKKKKRKEPVQDSMSTPFIKTEPRSASPIAAPPGRPAKRQKQGPRQVRDNDVYDEEEVRFEQGGGPSRGRYPLRSVQNNGPPSRYAPHNGQAEVFYVDSGSSRHYESEHVDDGRLSVQAQYQHRVAPSAPSYGGQYVGEEYSRPTHQPMATRQNYPEEAPRAPPYMSRPEDQFLRPQSPTMMPPPGPPLLRVIRDGSGREYFEPDTHAQVIRRPVAPVVRHGDPEVIYKRSATIRQSVAPPMGPEPELIYERSAPVRSVSRRPAASVYDDGSVYDNGSVIYRRSSPVYEVQRRVLPQPEISYDSGGYQQEYSTRTMPAESYQTIERRPVVEMPREYITRSVSVRPTEPVRYEAAHERSPRLHSVHPEGTMDPVHARPVVREYGMRPPESHVVQRSFSVRPPERYFERPPVAEEEVAYIGERRSARPHEVVYLEDRPRGGTYY